MTGTVDASAADRAAIAVARELRHLEPGPLAELRRMKDRSGAPMFWRLAARHPKTIGCREKAFEWMTIVRIMAILSDKGDPASRSPLHDFRRPLGAMLCDGGDPAWPQDRAGTVKPVFSERRFTQLLASRATQRLALLERAARALVRSRAPGSGVNVTDIAHVLLEPLDVRRLADPYYKRLDRALWSAEKATEGQD